MTGTWRPREGRWKKVAHGTRFCSMCVFQWYRWRHGGNTKVHGSSCIKIYRNILTVFHRKHTNFTANTNYVHLTFRYRCILLQLASIFHEEMCNLKLAATYPQIKTVLMPMALDRCSKFSRQFKKENSKFTDMCRSLYRSYDRGFWPGIRICETEIVNMFKGLALSLCVPAPSQYL